MVSTDGLDELARDRDDRARDRTAVSTARSRLRGGVGGGDRLAVGAERGDLGQAGRLELVETQCGAVDDVVPVQQADTVTVSVTCGRRATVCVPSSPSSRRTCGPSPRSTATIVGWAGSVDELGVSRSPVTSRGLRQCQGQVGGVRCCTTRCGAVHAVRGSPSVAA